MVNYSFILLICFVSYSLSVQFNAVAVLEATNPSDPITGTVKFTYDNETQDMTVTINATGIVTNPDSAHGIHIHSLGDLRGLLPGAGSAVIGGGSVGPHFNPSNANHSCTTGTSHAGDLGNWDAVGGTIQQTKTFTGQFSLISGETTSVIGRTLVLHANQNDCQVVASSGGRLALGVIGVASSEGKGGASSQLTSGICVLKGTTNCKTGACGITESGVFSFTDDGNGVLVRGKINKLEPAGSSEPHGIHIHDFGDLTSGDGASVGSHWNPNGQTHGLPPSDSRHAGDLGTVHAYDQDGNGYYSYTAYFSSWTLRVQDIIGHSLVIHLDTDHGLDETCRNSTGFSTGTAGARLFWCVIGIQNSADQTVPANVLPLPDTANQSYTNVWNPVPCGTCCIKQFGFPCDAASYTNGDFCTAGSTCCLTSDAIGRGANTYSCCNSSTVCTPYPEVGFIPSFCADKVNPCSGVTCRNGACSVVDGKPTCPLLSIAKNGTCPAPSAIGTCISECSDDSGCTGSQKCCSNGCGTVCTEPLKPICPDGINPVKCFKSPCLASKCPAFPDATCTDNYCGGCTASWSLDGQPVDCSGSCCIKNFANCTLQSLNNSDYCGPDSTCCLVSDGIGAGVGSYACCDSSQACVANPTGRFVPQICVDKYNPCGGINCPTGTRCTTENGVPKCKTDAPLCPDGLLPVQCAADPCSVSSCPAFPGATCTSNYCGGCNPIWTLDGKTVDCSGTCCVSKWGNCTAASLTNGDYCPIGSTCCLTSDGLGVGAHAYSCCDGSHKCTPNPYPAPQYVPNICSSLENPCEGVNCGDNYRCVVESGSPKCKQNTECNNCAGQVRPLLALICPGSTTSNAFTCNTTTCSYEMTPCPPPTTCATCELAYQPTCAGSTPSKPCGKKVCVSVYGTCIGSWSCEDCPAPPPVCVEKGCLKERCSLAASIESDNCVTTDHYATKLPCTRLSTCGYNSATGSCEWANTSSYRKCLTTPKYEDQCKTSNLCECVSSPGCGWCQRTVNVIYNTYGRYGSSSYTIQRVTGKCVHTDSAAGRCRRGTYIQDASCPPSSLVSEGSTASLLTKLSLVSETAAQDEINKVMAVDGEVGFQYTILLENVLDVIAHPTNPELTVVHTEVSIAGTTEPTQDELKILCNNLAYGLGKATTTQFIINSCVLLKINETEVVSFSTGQKRDVQTDHDTTSMSASQTYMSEITYKQSTSTSATTKMPVWAIAVLVVAIIVVLIAITVAIIVLTNGGKDGDFKIL